MPKFVPRQRKHKVLARQKQHGSSAAPTDAANANATEILPAEKLQREERKREIREELARESAGKMSGKKRKRLEKYIVRGTVAS
jgi:ATP-dependent RNA helicase DHX37/DHR1